jgi:hypothetical protein
LHLQLFVFASRGNLTRNVHEGVVRHFRHHSRVKTGRALCVCVRNGREDIRDETA